VHFLHEPSFGETCAGHADPLLVGGFAASVEVWTHALHPGHRWFFGPHDVTWGIGQMLAMGVPPSAWPYLWEAMVLGNVVATFRDEVDAKVNEGDGLWWGTGTRLAEAPLTDVEKELRGKTSTLQSVLVTYGEVGCVVTALLAISLKQVQITAYREGYIEDAVDNRGQGYRRVVWPTLEQSPGPESWSRIEPLEMNKRTYELLCKAVFSVV
jgi:hypothetical protein